MQYKARDVFCGEDVAIKLLARLSSPNDHAALIARLNEWVEAQSRLNHPVLVRTRQVQEYEGRPVIVSELAEGHKLADWLNAEGPLAPRVMLNVMRQLLGLLACAHGAGLAHGNLRMSDVLVCGDGQLRVVNLGLAYALGRVIRADIQGDLRAAGRLLFTMLHQVARAGNADSLRYAPVLEAMGVAAARAITPASPSGYPSAAAFWRALRCAADLDAGMTSLRRKTAPQGAATAHIPTLTVRANADGSTSSSPPVMPTWIE